MDNFVTEAAIDDLDSALGELRLMADELEGK